jgi:hypothetical protein
MSSQRVPVPGCVRLRPSLMCFDFHTERWFDTKPSRHDRPARVKLRLVVCFARHGQLNDRHPSRQQLYRFLRRSGQGRLPAREMSPQVALGTFRARSPASHSGSCRAMHKIGRPPGPRGAGDAILRVRQLVRKIGSRFLGMRVRMRGAGSTPAHYSMRANGLKKFVGGSGGIRTHDTVPRMPVFKTGAFNHSATLPSRSGA